MNDMNMENKTLESFLTSKQIKKGSNEEITHTEFGGKFKNRTFHINDEEYPDFKKLYFKDIIKVKKEHNILERQLTFKTNNAGYMLVDIDMHFDIKNEKRQYNYQDINVLIKEYLKIFQNTFIIDESTIFKVIVQEKNSPRNVTKGETSYVKDGIHIMFCIGIENILQQYIRSEILKVIPTIWSHIPVINEWKDVFDLCVTNGTNSWLAPLSKKKDDISSYKIVKAYNYNLDTDSDTWNEQSLINNEKDITTFYNQNYNIMFIRNKNSEKITVINDDVIEKIESFKKEHQKPTSIQQNQLSEKSAMPQLGGDESWQIPVNVVRQIRNSNDLQICLDMFLENLPEEKPDIKEAYSFTMTLPESYYGVGSYDKWIKTGFALKNINIYLLIVWLKFSSQSKTFDYNIHVDEICDHWIKFTHNPVNGVKKKSLMYWSRIENPEEYKKIKEQTADYYIEKSLRSLTTDQINGKGRNRGCCDYDIATAVYSLYNGTFVSTSIRNNGWWKYNGHFWIKDDMGTSLRNILSNKIRNLFLTKSIQMREQAMQIKTSDGDIDVESEMFKLLMAKSDMLLTISMKLASTHDKDNIMKECRELFYDPEFESKLDQDRYKLCCKNYIIDFKERTYRKGMPEDYISKCTNINYQPLSENDNNTIEDINNYLRKLFPRSNVLVDYVKNHLASILIGDTVKAQCLHYYNGLGQNGKSLFVKLIEKILGEYATDLDISFFTNERPGRGKATPDLVKLIGSRFAITSEPSEGDKLNEGPMKQLTSGTDKISYRGLYKEQESFVPQTHCAIMANHFLSVRGQDHGTWRRIRVLPFESLFTLNPVENDPEKPYQFKLEDNLEDKFEVWAPILLSMLIEIAFVNQGTIPICDIVAEETRKYREREDVVAAFISENLEKKDGQRVAKQPLFQLFRDWSESTYGTKVSGKNTDLANRMESMFGKYRTQPPGWPNVQIKKNYENTNFITDSETESITTTLTN